MAKSRAFIAIAFEIDDEEQAEELFQFVQDTITYSDLFLRHNLKIVKLGIVPPQERNPVSSTLGVTMNSL